MGKNKNHLIGLGLLLFASTIVSGQAKATQDFGTISIANPENPSEGLTIMDRNLGATSNDISNPDSYGYYYQWGNNYGFPSSKEVEKISADQVDASSYGPGNYYENDTFIIWNNWDSSNNINLWGGGNDNENNGRGLEINNPEDRQGPCPKGYHIPSLGEWLLLVKYWADTNNKTYNYKPEMGVLELDRGYSDFRNYFKMPLAGEYYISGNNNNWRDYINGEDYEYDPVFIRFQGNQSNPSSHYRTSSPAITSSSIDKARSFYMDDIFYFYVGNTDDRNRTSSIRCFKDSYEPEITTSKYSTTTQDTKKSISDFLGVITKTSNNNILTKGKNKTIGEFTIKSKNNNSLNLTSISLRNRNGFTCSDIKLIVDNSEINNCTVDGDLIYKMNETVSSKGILVKIILNKAEKGAYSIGLMSINNYYNYEDGLAIPFEFFTKRFVDLTVYIKNQVNKLNQTEFTLGIDKSDNSTKVYNIGLFTSSECSGSPVNAEPQKSIGEGGTEYTPGQILKSNNEESEQYINSIGFVIDKGSYVCITRSENPGYFDINGEELKVYRYITQNITQDTTQETTQDTTQNTKNEVINNGYTDEMNDAYEYAHNNGITTTNSIEKAKMNSSLTRIAMAKMLSQYAINVLGKEPDLSKGTKNFNDVTSKQNADYDNAVTLAYQLGIMGQGTNNFRPNDEVTRAEFVTALSRMLYSTPDGTDKYYTTHLTKLKQEGIISNDNPSIKEKRGYVMLMLMRSVK